MGIGKSEQMDGQLKLFTVGDGYVFLRDLKAGDVFVIGTKDDHSAPFEVLVNQPDRRAMSVRYESWLGGPKDSTWHYGDNDCGIKVEEV